MDLVEAAPTQCIEILLYFNLLHLVLFHGLQFKWRTFMMQMQAGAINLPHPPLPPLLFLSWASPDAERCALCLSLSHTHSRIHSLPSTPPSFSLSLQHRVTLALRPHEK